MTDYQRLMLDRLRDDFGVDVSSAELLDGADLDAWIFAQEDAVFERLHAELRAQRE